jgi:hypothetical protein
LCGWLLLLLRHKGPIPKCQALTASYGACSPYPRYFKGVRRIIRSIFNRVFAHFVFFWQNRFLEMFSCQLPTRGIPKFGCEGQQSSSDKIHFLVFGFRKTLSIFSQRLSLCYNKITHSSLVPWYLSLSYSVTTAVRTRLFLIRLLLLVEVVA